MESLFLILSSSFNDFKTSLILSDKSYVVIASESTETINPSNFPQKLILFPPKKKNKTAKTNRLNLYITFHYLL